MDRLEAMTILLAAVDTGSLSAASRHLRIPLATVSRRVAELEEHLHVRLLHRGHRKVILTDAGRSYVDSCRRIMEEIAEVERTASGEYRAPQGELIITAPAVLGRSHVLPIVAEFQRAFPDIRMRLQLTDRYVNLAEEHVDVAVRIGELPDSSMIVTRLGAIRRAVRASPAYLKARGVPKQPAALASYGGVAYDPAAPWEIRRNGASMMMVVQSLITVNLGEVAAAAAVVGAGIARVLSYLIEDLLKSGSLVSLLDAYELSPRRV